MLAKDQDWLYELTDGDRSFYRTLLPREHTLLDALELIPWQAFVPELESYYCPHWGQPAIPPLLMFKLEFLRYFCRLSDREVVARAQTDVLFRWFLQIPVQRKLPDASLLTRFRGRLGAEGFKKLFDRLVACARDAHLIRDRLRLKDATHVIDNVAVPTTLQLLAQLRTRMLAVIAKIDPEAAAGFEIQADLMRVETDDAEDAIKLQARLDLVLDILGWIQQQPAPQPSSAAGSDDRLWAKLQAVRELAEKITADFLHPGNGHRTLSVVDPDARRGKHGDFYDGYLLDVMIDADSEIITELEVLPAGGDEAKDAVHLVEMEHERHGNQIEQLSIDGAGFNGEMLRALESDEGLGVDVIVPPRDFANGTSSSVAVFPASSFELSADGSQVTCPAGEQSSYRQASRNGTIFRFKLSQCVGCPLQAQCKPELNSNSPFGRSVTKNDYEVEYERARAKSKTAEYEAVRRRHPAIERKLNDIVRHQRGRFARYWGLPKVRLQECMTCLVVNVKRITRLLKAELCAEPR
ncbi:MAG: transposase [Planctomycetota bacterium]